MTYGKNKNLKKNNTGNKNVEKICYEIISGGKNDWMEIFDMIDWENEGKIWIGKLKYCN